MPANATTAAIPVTLIDDGAEETLETLNLTLSGGTGYSVGSPGEHTVIITPTPAMKPKPKPAVPPVRVSIAASSRFHRESENSGTTYDVKLKVRPASTSDMTVTYGTWGSATSGSDYKALSGTVSVAAGATTATIPVTIVDDAAEEGEEDLQLALSNGTGYLVGGGSGRHTLTIVDDEMPVVSFPVKSDSAGEGSGTYEVTMNLSPAPTSDRSLNIIVSDRSRVHGEEQSHAILGSDYTVDLPATRQGKFESSGNSWVSVRVPVHSGATVVTVPITIVDDDKRESDEYVNVYLEKGQGYTVKDLFASFPGRGTARNSGFAPGIDRGKIYYDSQEEELWLRIIDNDGPAGGTTPSASFASASLSVDEDSGASDVTVNLSPAPAADIALSYTVEGTATSGSDYAALSGTVAVSKGATTATIPVAVIDDSENEGAETVVLTLAAGEGYKVGSTGTHTLTIAASDPPTASFASASQSADEDSGTSNVTVNLSPAPATDITLSYTVDGTATSGSDYTALSGTVTVPKDATTATLPVTLIDDGAHESSETVVLTLAAGSDYAVGSPDTHTLTIAANDPPTASFASASQSVDEDSGTSNVTVNLSPAPATDITLAYTVDGTATSGSDYTALSGTVAVPKDAATATLPVTLIDDGANEDAETVVLTLATGSGYAVGSPDTHTLTIAASDPPTASFASASQTAQEGSGTSDVTSEPVAGPGRRHHARLHGGRHGDFRLGLYGALRHAVGAQGRDDGYHPGGDRRLQRERRCRARSS